MDDVKLDYKTVEDLTPTENMELVGFANTSYFKVVCKVLEFAVIEQRDRAMGVDPAKESEQRARMTEAHAMAKFYSRFRGIIDSAKLEHMGAVAAKEIEENLKDQQYIEELIVRQ